MNPKWFGDSYDIVKRFFAMSLNDLGYVVFVDPMFTGEWNGDEEALYSFLQMRPVREYRTSKSALFLDPDTGIRSVASPRHTTIARIVEQLSTHEIVFSFDQSFSRGLDSMSQMKAKLEAVEKAGGVGLYFDSHARFLFTSLQAARVESLREYFVETGLPASRLVLL